MSEDQIRLIAFGAHPDDCEIICGGLATKYVSLGYPVKFVSVTNGNAGHHVEQRDNLAKIRLQEAQEAAKILGIEYDVLNYNDGELMPTLEVRNQIISLIREWKADVVLSHRPNDYHPDHRYTGSLVQDAAYLVTVPPICPETTPLTKNPFFFYFWDNFKKPYSFQPDAAISIDDVMDKKWDMMHCHGSQFYEWLPYVEKVTEPVPEDDAERRAWLPKIWAPFLTQMTECCRDTLSKRYGADKAQTIQFAEAYEICEYGRNPDQSDLERLFPA